MKLININKAIIIAVLMMITFSIPVSALSFYNISGNSISGIGNGQGYFDDELDFFNLSAMENIYCTAEKEDIYIFSVTDYVYNGASSHLMSKGASDFVDCEVVGGYLYYADGSGVLKRKTRASTTLQLASDTLIPAGSQLQLTSTGNVKGLQAIGSNLYFRDADTIKHIDTSVASYPVVNDITLTISDGGAAYQLDSNFYVFEKSGTLTVLYTESTLDPFGAAQKTFVANSTTTQLLNTTTVYGLKKSTSDMMCEFTVSQNYIYQKCWIDLTVDPNGQIENLYYRSNYSLVQANSGYISGVLQLQDNGMYLGEYDTNFLYNNEGTGTYNQGTFIEQGVSTQTYPYELTYTTAEIYTDSTTYYNNSNIKINWQIEFDDSLLSPVADNYYWKYVVFDPDDVPVHEGGIPDVDCTGILTITCRQFGNSKLSGNWDNGTYTVKMYEVNKSVNLDALLDSYSFNVLNQQSNTTVSTSTSDISSDPSAQTGLSKIDSWTSMFGLGVNPLSKFLFAVVAICGLIIIGSRVTPGDWSGSMITGFGGFAFFTYIEYIPSWCMVLVAFIMALRMGWFR